MTQTDGAESGERCDLHDGQAFLPAGQDQYRWLINSLREGVWAVDKKGFTTFVNPRMAEMLGYDAAQMVGEHVFSFLDEEGVKVCRRALEARGGGNQQHDLVLRGKDGMQVWATVSTCAIFDERGDYKGMLAGVTDITERRQVAEYQALTARLLEELNRPAEWPEVLEAVIGLIKDFTGLEAVGIRLHEGEDFPYFLAKGFPARFLQAESQLCAREGDGSILRDERGKAVLECMCGRILSGRTDPAMPFFSEGGSFWTNSTTELLAGTTEDGRGARTRNRCNAAGYESVALIPIRADQEIVGLLQLNDGRRNRFTPVMVRFLEQMASSIGLAIRRHEMQEQIRRELTVSRSLAELSNTLIASSTCADEIANMVLHYARLLTGSEHGIIFEVNPGAEIDAVHAPGATITCWRTAASENLPNGFTMGPDGDCSGLWRHALERRRAFFTKCPAEFETAAGPHKAHPALKNLLAVPVIVGGGLVGQVAVANSNGGYTRSDLDTVKRLAELYALAVQRKRAEEELHQARDELERRVQRRTEDLAAANKLLETMFSSIELKVAYMDRDFNFIRVNRAYAEGAGRPQEFFVGKNHFDLYPSRENEAIFREVLRTARPFFAHEKPFEFPHHAGRQAAYWDWSLQPVVGADGLVTGVVLSLIDVTERVSARQEAEKQRVRLFSVLNLLPGYVVLIGPDLSIRYANNTFLELFGDSGGQPCHKVLRGMDRPCDDCPARRVFEKQRPEVWEWTSEDGKCYRIYGYPFSDVDGSQLVLKLGIDITDRKILENQVLEAGVMERRRIGRDLHDSLGQTLTGVAFMSKVLAKRLRKKSLPEAEKAAEIVRQVTDSIALTRSLARGLYPVRLEADGLANALWEFANDTSRRFGISCIFRQGREVLISDNLAATHLFHIAQEAVTNAIRHGGATNILIRLDEDDHSASLTIRDDGRGLGEETQRGEGMGLPIMKYRAGAIGGSLDVSSGPGGGTVVTCSFRKPGCI